MPVFFISPYYLIEGIQVDFSAIIEHPADYSPSLLIGSAAVSFRQTYEGIILTVSSSQDVVELIGRYTGIQFLSRPIVISDLAFMARDASSMLLKFIEESPLPLILLATYDNINPILLSRVRTVMKQSQVIKSSFLSLKQGIAYIRDMAEDAGEETEKISYYDRVKAIASICPVIYALERRLPSSRVRERIIQLLD